MQSTPNGQAVNGTRPTSNQTRDATTATTTATATGTDAQGAPLDDRNAGDATPTAKPTPETAHLVNFGNLLREFGDDAQAANEARLSGVPRGPVSGLPGLDRELSGAWLPGLHWIHGNAGAGKTAFALQVAARCQCPALFVTCEMSPVELLRRHTARATGTFLGRLKSGELARDAAEQLARDAIATSPQMAIADATRAGAPLQFLRDAAHIARGDAPHILVVVDSLHSWALRLASGLPEYEALNVAISDLQTLAHALKCPVLVVSERSRAAMQSGGLNAGAGTRKIEYSGETVLDLHRENGAASDGAGAPLQFLHGAAKVVRGDAPHILVVVDSLHSWALRLASGLSEYEALNVAISDLQTLAHSLKCPVLVVSERSRSAMQSGGVNAGAGTRKIEYSGETVIDLNRDADTKQDGAGEVPIKLTLTKNRHGATGKPLDLRFNGALQRFTEAK